MRCGGKTPGFLWLFELPLAFPGTGGLVMAKDPAQMFAK